MQKPIIALDADGVLLDYNLAYASAWQRAFGVYPRERDPHAYWAKDRWEVETLQGLRLQQFRDCMDASFWDSVPAMPGAIAACQALHGAGFRLVCVTALEERFATARQSNLRQLGFPIETVIATGKLSHGKSPKAAALQDLQPVAFVDDFLPYLVGVPADIHCALILRPENGSPNTGVHLQTVSSTHCSLLDFSQWWINSLGETI